MDFFTQTICGQIINGFKFDWSLHEMNQMVVLVTFVPEAESPQNHARISVLSDLPILLQQSGPKDAFVYLKLKIAFCQKYLMRLY